MANLPALRLALEKKLQVTTRSVNRKIKTKEDLTLQPREVAALIVAVEAGLSIKKYATPDELAQVRSAMNGQSSAAPSDAPNARPAATPVAAATVRARSTGTPHLKRTRGKTVFVVHGRNAPLRRSMFDFLRAIGLNPLEWTSALKQTDSGSPTIMEVIEVMLTKAQAILVLLTPDDLVQLKPELQKRNEKRDEKELRGQARPNVLFEAGIAMGSKPKATVLVQIGDVKAFTDVGGIHVTQLDNSSEARNELAQKLIAANCTVDTSGTDWLNAGDFEQETYDD